LIIVTHNAQVLVRFDECLDQAELDTVRVLILIDLDVLKSLLPACQGLGKVMKRLGLDGADVCRLVKAHPHWKKTFLLLMSARISDREIDMYRRIGANEILRKPFEPSVALEAVKKAIGPAEGQ